MEILVLSNNGSRSRRGDWPELAHTNLREPYIIRAV